MRQKNFTVADFTRARGLENRSNGRFHEVICHHEFHFYLWYQVDGVLAPAVKLGVSLLPAVAADVADRHAYDARLDQGLFYGLKPRGLDDRFDLRHVEILPWGCKIKTNEI